MPCCRDFDRFGCDQEHFEAYLGNTRQTDSRQTGGAAMQSHPGQTRPHQDRSSKTADDGRISVDKDWAIREVGTEVGRADKDMDR